MDRDRSSLRSDPRDEVPAAFGRIRADRSHGARALATEALRTLSNLLDGWAHRPEVPLRPRFRQVARALEEAQPAMGPFLRWAEEWRQIASTGASNDLVGRARAWTRRERSRMAAETPRLIRTSRRRFPRGIRDVVTISRSQTVLLALSALGRTRRPTRVSVLESLPGGEGRLFAQDLRRAGLSARVVPDRAGRAAAAAADLVIIGADAVLSDGSVLHKVGTRSLAMAASNAGVPVVVVAGRSKFTGRPAPRRPLPAWFDRTPSRYISEIWTDAGVRVGGARVRPRPYRAPL
jgi:translation initiation factor 2B subunit (eIF-2B alpha/beta/delta family)